MTGLQVLVERSKHGKFQVCSLNLVVPCLPEAFHGYRIVQLTDMHFGPCTTARHMEKAIALTQSLNPDLALLTGDYLQASPTGLPHAFAKRVGVRAASWMNYRRAVRRLAEQLSELLAELKPKDGILGVLGNHDHLEGAGTVFRQLGRHVSWLVNDAAVISKDGRDLLIAGTDDHKRGKLDLTETSAKAAALEAVAEEPAVLRILLSHNPDVTMRPESGLINNFDLMLCGHTHGGQICLPLFGPVATRTKQKEYTSGLNRYNNTFVYINHGIGYGLIPLRTWCPPEIALITLYPA